QDELLDRLLRILGPIDQVVEVRPDQQADALQQLHRDSPFGGSTSATRGVPDTASRRPGTRANRSLTFTPASASTSAGAWAMMLATSATTLWAPAPSWPFPVDTIVILSTLLSGSPIARTTSGRPERSLSMTAAWLYSRNASAFTCIASASAWP